MLADACPNVVPRHVELERLDALSRRASRWPTCSAPRSAVVGPRACCSAPTRRSSRAAGSAPIYDTAARHPRTARHRGRLPRGHLWWNLQSVVSRLDARKLPTSNCQPPRNFQPPTPNAATRPRAGRLRWFGLGVGRWNSLGVGSWSWEFATRRAYFTAVNSTSNTSVALAGIVGGMPVRPVGEVRAGSPASASQPTFIPAMPCSQPGITSLWPMVNSIGSPRSCELSNCRPWWSRLVGMEEPAGVVHGDPPAWPALRCRRPRRAGPPRG